MMDSPRRLSSVLKAISLVILDVFVFLLVFSFWALLNLPLFPWAFCAILVSLVLVHVLVLASVTIVRNLGIGSYSSLMVCTLLFFLFVMTFTGATYIAISTRTYLLVTLLAALAYVAISAGLCLAGSRHVGDEAKHVKEQTATLDANVLVMKVEEEIKLADERLGIGAKTALVSAFQDVTERLRMSTPFGRTDRPAPAEMEFRILSKLSTIGTSIATIQSGNDPEASIKPILELMKETKTMIVNREKLMIQ